jgi:asparagine synthetase A
MKKVYEVLRQKELEVSRLKKEVEALRVAAPLLSEGEEGRSDNKPRSATSTAVNAPPQPDRAAGWEAKRWP